MTRTHVLVVVDMQNDFVTGPLGTKRAREIAPKLADYIRAFDGDVVYTIDTHAEDYLSTQEGRRLPVTHCVKGTDGWKLAPDVWMASRSSQSVFEKPAFGSEGLMAYLKEEDPSEIYFAGVCTGICVLANAVLAKTACPEAGIHILKDLCGCVTKESHETALKAMELLQMDVE